MQGNSTIYKHKIWIIFFFWVSSKKKKKQQQKPNKNDPVAEMTLKTRGRADLWALFITGTRKTLDDYLSYLIWFQKTLPLVNRKRKSQNRISWAEGMTGWNEEGAGCEGKETSWDGVGAQWDEGGAHLGQNLNFKIKITLDSVLHTHTQPITAQKGVILDEVNGIQETGENTNSTWIVFLKETRLFGKITIKVPSSRGVEGKGQEAWEAAESVCHDPGKT